MTAMLSISNLNVSRFKFVFNNFCRYYSSLYVTGDKASKTFSVLTPHIDFEERIANREELVQNIKSRNLDIVVEKVESRWIFYRHLRNQKFMLQKTRQELSKQISSLLNEPEKNKEELDKLKFHADSAKNDLENLKDFMYGVEESAALHALSLPNKLHPKTPLDKDIVVKKSHCKRTETKCHSEIYPQFFHFSDNANLIYLLEEAALFEQAASCYLQEKLLQFDFVQISNPNFCTGVITEGCTNQNHKLVKINSDAVGMELFLTGSASLNAFMAYYARFHLQPTQMSQKMFTIGRLYENLTYSRECSTKNLFNLSQNSSIDIFCLLKDSASATELAQKLVNQYLEMYDELDLTIACVLISAKDLKHHESLRYSFQMFSNSLQKFVEVGNISMFEDFLSKRLLVIYGENKTRHYAHIVGGTVLNIHKCLGCLIENNELLEKDVITQKLKKFL